MDFVCDAPEGKSWFRIVTEGEAIAESQEMRHAVEKHFRHQWEAAAKSFKPASSSPLKNPETIRVCLGVAAGP